MSRPSHGPWFRKSKNTWFVWFNGKQVSLQVKGFSNKAEAFKAWHRLMAGVEAKPVAPESVERKPEALPVAPKPKPVERERLTKTVEPSSVELKPEPVQPLTRLVQAFLDDAEARGVKPASVKNYRLFLSAFVEAFPNLDKVNAQAVERWSKSKGWSQSYRSGFIATLNGFFKWAITNNHLVRSPIAGIKRPAKQSRGRRSVISEADHRKLVAVASGQWKAFIQLLWLTGARPGEIASLTADAVDLANKVIVLSDHKTADQTGKDRVIVLNEEAVSILQDRIAERPTGLLFTGQHGQPLTPQATTKVVHRLCEKAKVKAIAYGYRHTYATDALAQGVPDATVASLLGHSGTTMLHKHYAHLTSRIAVLREAQSRVR